MIGMLQSMDTVLLFGSEAREPPSLQDGTWAGPGPITSRECIILISIYRRTEWIIRGELPLPLSSIETTQGGQCSIFWLFRLLSNVLTT